MDDYLHEIKGNEIKYNYFLLELLIKEPVASVRDIDYDGNWVFGVNRLNEQQIAFIHEVHQGCLDFVNQYIEMIINREVNEDESSLICTVLKLLNDDYFCYDENLKEMLIGFDEFTNRQIVC